MVRKEITLLGMVATGADRPMLARVPVVQVAACSMDAATAHFSLPVFIFVFRPSRAQEAGAQTGSSRQIPEHRPANVMSLQGIVRDQQGRAVPGVHLDLRNAAGAHYETRTGVEGIFRLRDVELGIYKLTLTKPGFRTLAIERVELIKRELTTLELQMQALTALAPENKGPSGLPGTPRTPAVAAPTSPYPGVNRSAPDVAAVESAAEPIPPESANFSPQPDRWDTAMPEWRRYEHAARRALRQGPLVRSVQSQSSQGRLSHLRTALVFQLHRHQRNRLWMAAACRCPAVWTPSVRTAVTFSVAASRPCSRRICVSLSISFAATLAFRPVDFRVRFTPEINLNFLQTRERGIVNVDPREGTNRFDTHVGLQEAFVEAKIRDLSPNYDFVSVRAGIQQFTSDFRGFLFSEEQPGVRIFGNLRSNRLAYNSPGSTFSRRIRTAA